MALNAYYRSEPDPRWSQFREDSNGHAEFYDAVRDYLLDEHSSNFTQFLEFCTSPYDSFSYWEDLAKSGSNAKTIVDNIFEDVHAEQQQRFLQNVVISAELKNTL